MRLNDGRVNGQAVRIAGESELRSAHGLRVVAVAEKRSHLVEHDKLLRDHARLTEQLRKAEIVIDVQKKVGALLGWPIVTADPEPKA